MLFMDIDHHERGSPRLSKEAQYDRSRAAAFDYSACLAGGRFAKLAVQFALGVLPQWRSRGDPAGYRHPAALWVDITRVGLHGSAAKQQKAAFEAAFL